MWSDIVAIYRGSKKYKDVNWFTEHVARPPAAVVVYALRNTRVTPNQVTFMSAIVAAGAAAMLAGLPGCWWLIAAAVVYEFSFVLDCADGQLARLRKVASPIGHLLDFLMDELKAMLIFGCVGVRLWRESGDDRILLVALGGLFCLAAGISLTTFTRRPEYTGPAAPAASAAPSGKTSPMALLEWPFKFVVHYPQYIWLCAAVDRIDLYFWAYAGTNALYFLKTLAAVLLKLGRFAPSAAPTTEPAS